MSRAQHVLEYKKGLTRMIDYQYRSTAGVDVSKDALERAVGFRGVTDTVPYDAAGLDVLIDRLRADGVSFVVLEATGGYERRLVAALAEADIAFHVANPCRVRDFAKAAGQHAKTDTLDAHLLVEYGVTMRPKPHVLPDENRQKLVTLSNRRRQLIAMRTAEFSRLDTLDDPEVADMIHQVIEQLNTQLEHVEQRIDTLIADDPAFARQVELIQSTPGLGAQTAGDLLTHLPELGDCSTRQIARLAGLAPINRDSGKKRGPRTTGGGRKHVRTMLYMPTLAAIRHNPRIRAFYRRLVDAGKPKMIALTAAMRKLLTYLNAMIKQQKTWPEFNQNP